MADGAKNPRASAKESLIAFAKHGKYTNLEVASRLSKAEFSDADRRLYTGLVYGVAERIPTLDYIISTLSTRQLEKIDTETLTCARLGLYQLLYTDRIPDHAAVSETVAVCPAKSKAFVNALLREFIRRGKRFDLPADRFEKMSVEYSCPTELCRFLTEKLGEDDAKGVLSHSAGKSSVTIRVNTLKTTAEKLINEVFPDGKISAAAPDMIELDSLGNAELSSPLYFVQDAASRLAVSALDPRPGETVVDTCAAPGGKSFSAAIDMKSDGKIYSFDIHENKIGLIRSGAERLGINIIEAGCRSAAEPDESLAGSADRVICDAPCSGLGVISKKPDIKYKNLSDVERLPEVQLRVLTGASAYVRPGGVIVYSTCTVNPDENGGVVERFLSANPEFKRVPFAVGNVVAPDGEITFLPHIHGTDGFFVCKMERKN